MAVAVQQHCIQEPVPGRCMLMLALHRCFHLPVQQLCVQLQALQDCMQTLALTQCILKQVRQLSVAAVPLKQFNQVQVQQQQQALDPPRHLA
jgi:hypothetical protein